MEEDLEGTGSASRWLPIMSGVLLILFGLVAIAWPGMTLVIFTVIFGLYALIAGFIHVITGIIHIARGWTSIGSVLLGILFIAAGAYVFNHPGVSALTLVILVGFTFIVSGIFEIVMGIANDLPHKALTIISGVLGVLVGLILLRYPLGGGVAYVWVIGIYTLVAGAIQLAVGLGAGRHHRSERRGYAA